MSKYFVSVALLFMAAMTTAQTDSITHLVSQYVQNRPVGTELSVGIIDKGEIRKLGVRKTESGVEVIDNSDGLFELGSVTKVFTAQLIMQLVHNGQLELDAPIEEYLPVAPLGNSYQGAHINTKHLLMHTSGLESGPSPLVLPYIKALLLSPKNPNRFIKAKHYYKYWSDFELDYTPGEQWVYNNAGYGLLGEILINHYQQSWAEILQAQLLQPLGMLRTYTRIPKEAAEKLVVGITNKGKRAKTWDMNFIDPAGTIKSNVDDMLRYMQAQLAPSTMGLPWLASAQEPMGYSIRMPEGKLWEQNSMGLGWWHNLEQAHLPFLWHGGSSGGYNAFIGIHPPTGKAVVVLGNLSSSHAQGRAEKRIPWAVRLGQTLMWQ